MAVGFLTLSLAAAPLLAQARGRAEPPQRGSPPKEDTPYLIVTAFKSADKKLGVEMADEFRHRVADEYSAKDLFVVTKRSIESTLQSSGYNPDSSLSSSDLMELAKQLRGEEAIDGSIQRAGNGVHVEARILMKAGQQTIAQPLPGFDAKDAGDAAKTLEKEMTEANKAVPQYKACRQAGSAAKYPEAVTAARAALALYPNSTFALNCLVVTLSQSKASPDDMIQAANQLIKLDPTSSLALANLADAYMTKGDTTKALETQVTLFKADPSNTALAQSIVASLATSGAPEKALPIIDSLLVSNPGDPQMLLTKWRLQLRLAASGNRAMYKTAMATGEELVKVDTAQASVDYYTRMIGAAQADSNTAAMLEFANKAMTKFPKEQLFPTVVAQSLLKSGQPQQALVIARKATTADPKNTNAWLLAIQAANAANMKDSTAAFAQMAIAAGADKATFGTALLAPTQELVAKAQASKARADWQAALTSAQSVDATATSAASKFFVGLASFQVALDMAQTDLQDQYKAVQKSNKKSDKDAACATAKQIDDLLTTTQVAMPAGASIDKGTAGQILGGVNQLTEFTGSVKKAFACK